MSEYILWRDRPTFLGIITSIETKPHLQIAVLLDDKRTILASLSNRVARLMYRIKIGDRVLVRFRNPSKLPRIIGFEKKYDKCELITI